METQSEMDEETERLRDAGTKRLRDKSLIISGRNEYYLLKYYGALHLWLCISNAFLQILCGCAA
jgi:hypothetical protein